MIYIGLLAALIGKEYEFCCDETINTGDFVRKVVMNIQEAENILSCPCPEEVELINTDARTFLNKNYTLKENGVRQGSRLLLL